MILVKTGRPYLRAGCHSLLLAHDHGSSDTTCVQSRQLAALDLGSKCLRVRERRRRRRACGRAREEEADVRPSKQKPRKFLGEIRAMD
jgi:hypothetical protein